MDPNNNPFNTQNSTNYPFKYPNSNNYIFQNQSSNKQGPQNIPNYGFPPNFIMSSSNPSYRPYYGMMPYSSQTPPDYSSTPMRNENISNVGVDEFPEFSTQMDIGAMRGGQGATPNADDSTPIRRKSPKWTTDQNLVLISGWIKYGTDSVVGRNQKSDSYWGKIADYCNEHCSFDPPRDGAACRNHYNYMSKILNKWIGAYDNAKRMQQSGWSENDVLAKAHELYSSGKSGHFLLMSERLVVHKGTTTVILEAVATYDLWIWHGNTPKVNFFVNQRPYNMAYYLADGIYPSYPTFVKSIRLPQSEPDKLFAKYHEGCRKDIERAFGVLQARFKIIREPARLWDINDLALIMRSCIILNNMIVEDERDIYAQNWTDYDQSEASKSSTPESFSTEVLPAFANHVRARSVMRDSNVHHELQADLVKHIWEKFGIFHD
ncbi:uncharacterized protein LOC131621735 [Vicia villosa]|uniref:uncharacterized protein LOC131621735 n=1 Tax=Vicia villosa TaxID=3911 RepID=UPI00273B236B|nr:uncharacterized protein LOC131621735 [Vicia villosa]